MKKFSVMVKKVLMSTLTAGIFAFGFTSCTDDNDALGDNSQQAIPQGAKTEMLEAYGLTFQTFINADDVTILNADTTQLSVSKAYAEKMGIKSFVNHPLGIWHSAETLSYLRKCTGEKVVGDRIIIDVTGATLAEVIGNKAVNLKSDIYVNQDANAVKTRAAGNNIPEYAAKYVDNDNVIHPAYIHMTDPYGYDKEYNTPDEPVSDQMTRAAEEGKYMYMTADEIAAGNTRWGCHNTLIHFKNSFEKEFQFPIGKGSKDSLFVNFATEMEFGLNYFITIDGGIKWNWCIPKPYLEKFEAGVDGSFDFKAEISAGWKKEWKLDKDKWRWELFKFRGYTFTFFIGPIPVAITSDPHLDFAIDGEVDAVVSNSFTYEYSNSFKGGFGYQDGKGFYPITDFVERKNKFDMDPLNITLKATAGMGLYLCCDLKLYGLVGPKLGVGPRLGGELEASVSPARKEASFKCLADLKVNAVLGAKVEVLGYELADQTLIYPLTPRWIIFAKNWELPEDEEIHKSPEQKKVESYKPQYMKELEKYFTTLKSSQSKYNNLVNWLMALKGYTHDEAEDHIFNKLMETYPGYPKYENDNDKLAAINQIVNNYGSEIYNQYTELASAKDWKEMQEAILQSPAYAYYKQQMKDMCGEDMDLEEVHKAFYKEYGREPANVVDDHKRMMKYMICYGEIIYYNTPQLRKNYSSLYSEMFKYCFTQGCLSNWHAEQAAYLGIALYANQEYEQRAASHFRMYGLGKTNTAKPDMKQCCKKALDFITTEISKNKISLMN